MTQKPSRRPMPAEPLRKKESFTVPGRNLPPPPDPKSFPNKAPDSEPPPPSTTRTGPKKR